jgi:SAM-dependent methyltransferase
MTPQSPTSSSSQARKELERELYDEAYAVNPKKLWSSERIHHLRESEEYFCSRLSTLVPKKRVLEIGMGNGSHCILAHLAGAREVVGVDISQAAVELAKRNANQAGIQKGIQFIQGDIETLGEQLGQFDLIIDHEVFSSLSWDAVMTRLPQLLGPGGILLGMECLDDNPLFRFNRWFGRILQRRTAWSVQNIMHYKRLGELEAAELQKKSIRFFHLFLVLSYPIGRALPGFARNHLFEFSSSLDRKILGRRAFERFAFKSVFEFERQP